MMYILISLNGGLACGPFKSYTLAEEFRSQLPEITQASFFTSVMIDPEQFPSRLEILNEEAEIAKNG